MDEYSTSHPRFRTGKLTSRYHCVCYEIYVRDVGENDKTITRNMADAAARQLQYEYKAVSFFKNLVVFL